MKAYKIQKKKNLKKKINKILNKIKWYPLGMQFSDN